MEENLLFSNRRCNDFLNEEDILKSGLIKLLNGNISFNGEGVRLFKFFEKFTEEIAREMECEEKKYPLLLPNEVLEKARYLYKYSHHCILCEEVDADIKKISDKLSDTNFITINDVISSGVKHADYSLSPSACYHTYLDYENQILDTPIKISFQQNVCRNEGDKIKTDSFGRFTCYNIRELVFIGSEEYVRKNLSMAEELIKRKFIEMNFSFDIEKASDSFALPESEIVERMQLARDVKHEIRTHYSNGKSLAVASINYHDESFSKPFKICVNNTKKTVSGCIGFGIERLVLTYLSQFGSKLIKNN